MEATCFSSLWIQLVLVACEESNAFSICSTWTDKWRMSCQSELVRVMPKAGVLVAVLAGGTLGCFCNTAKGGISKLEGPGLGVDHWEVGRGEPTERDELFTPKESRLY
jgi:hypothetical protein